MVVDAGRRSMWMPGSANVGNVGVAKLAATPCRADDEHAVEVADVHERRAADREA